MNVALTRARSSIWILGDATKLRSNQYWSQLIADAEARNMFRKVRPRWLLIVKRTRLTYVCPAGGHRHFPLYVVPTPDGSGVRAKPDHQVQSERARSASGIRSRGRIPKCIGCASSGSGAATRRSRLVRRQRRIEETNERCRRIAGQSECPKASEACNRRGAVAKCRQSSASSELSRASGRPTARAAGHQAPAALIVCPEEGTPCRILSRSCLFRIPDQLSSYQRK